MDFFSDSYVFQINIGTLSYFLNRKEVWMVFFYESDSPESQDFKDTWRELADKYNGLFRVAAVNCLHEGELCEDEFEVKERPKILCYSANQAAKPVQFPGGPDVKAIANLAIKHMENYSKRVTSKNYEEFFRENSDRIKSLLFTNKPEPPVILKKLSKDFKDKVDFGMIYHDQKDLFKK